MFFTKRCYQIMGKIHCADGGSEYDNAPGGPDFNSRDYSNDYPDGGYSPGTDGLDIDIDNEAIAEALGDFSPRSASQTAIDIAKNAGKFGMALSEFGPLGTALGIVGGGVYGYFSGKSDEFHINHPGGGTTSNAPNLESLQSGGGGSPGGGWGFSDKEGSGSSGGYANPYNTVTGGFQPFGLGQPVPATSGTTTGTASPTTMEGSVQAGIAAQEAMRDKIKEMYAPFYDSAVTGGLEQLQAFSGEGELDYTPSRLYEYSKMKGERNIKRTQAAKGQFGSSATAEKLSDLNMGLASEEMDRLYSGQLSRVQLGAGAADIVNSANTSLGGNVSGLYTGLGSGLNIQSQQQGLARQSAYQGLSSSLSGLAKYMEAS